MSYEDETYEEAFEGLIKKGLLDEEGNLTELGQAVALELAIQSGELTLH